MTSTFDEALDWDDPTEDWEWEPEDELLDYDEADRFADDAETRATLGMLGEQHRLRHLDD